MSAPQPPAPSRSSDTPWALAGLGLGVLLALLPIAFGPGAGAALAPEGGGGAVALWVVDRDAQRVLQLDRDLFVVGERRLPHPVGVVPTAAGGAWVACALEGRPRGAHRLVLLDPDLRELARVELGEVLALAPGFADEVLVLEAPRHSPERVLWVDTQASPRALLELPGARWLATGGGWVAAADGAGRLECLGPGGERTVTVLPGPLGPLVAAPGGWWLVADGGRSLARLAHEGTPLGAARLSLADPRLTPCPSGGVWVSGGPTPTLERRGRGGEAGSELRGLDLALQRGPRLALGEERLLVAGPGAMAVIDATGRTRLAQGGFVGLADVAAAHRSRSGARGVTAGDRPEG